MKTLTKEEFHERAKALQRAKKIFLDSGLTNNITNAFIEYQEIFAEREREIFISTMVGGNQPKTFMDRYERPKCPECGANMRFRLVYPNSEGILTQLVCESCDTVLNDSHNLAWWQKNLRKVEDDGSPGVP